MSSQIQITGETKVKSLTGVLVGTSGVVSSLNIDGSLGIPQLDVNGKIIVSQLPNSVMEYKGTWDASTNTPTLVNGTGNQGDVYLCSVAGTVNFGAGAIAFVVSDQVIYSGSIWQKASGTSGTVTSVAASITGNSLGITGSPITTAGTLAFAFAGTNLQYINGAGNLTTFPSLTGFVPYTGATQAVDLGAFDLTVNFTKIGAGTGGNSNLRVGNNSFTSNTTGSYNTAIGTSTLTSNTTGSNNTAMGVQALFSNTTGSSNTSIGTFTLGLNTGSYNTTLGASALQYNTTGQNNTAIGYNSGNSITTGSNNTIVGAYMGTATLSGNVILADGTGSIKFKYDGANTFLIGNVAIGAISAPLFQLEVTGTAKVSGVLTLSSTISNGTYTYTLPSATGTLALTSDISYPVTSVFGRTGAVVATEGDYTLTQLSDVTITSPSSGQVLKYNGTAWINDTDANTGTVTSVGLSSATSGVTIGSTPVTTSGTITIAIATATTSQNGLLSSTDWTTFNSKQAALTIGNITSSNTAHLTITGGTGAIIGSGVSVSIIPSAIVASGLTLTTTGTSGAATFSGSTLNIPDYGSALSAYLPLAGGTLTGALSGTSATFSSSVTAQTGEFISGGQDGSVGSVVRISTTSVNAAARNWGIVNTWDNFGDLTFRVSNAQGGNALSAGTSKMVLFSSGNVAIGTTTDSGYKLDVNGTGRFSGMLTIYNNQLTVTGGGYDGTFADSIFFGGNSEGTNYRNKISNSLSSNAANQKMKFSVASGATTWVDALTLTGTGAATFSSTVTLPNNTYLQFKNTSGAAQNVLTTDTGNSTVLRPSASGGYIAFQNYANNANNVLVADSGIITFNNLAGTGSRAVLADASGNLSAPVSDISVKQNITPIGYGLNEISKMNPVWFDFIDGYKNFGEGRQNGNIAQEMEAIIPEAVFTTPSTGKMGINYDQLHAVYIKAIQELSAKNDALETRLQLLENK